MSVVNENSGFLLKKLSLALALTLPSLFASANIPDGKELGVLHTPRADNGQSEQKSDEKSPRGLHLKTERAVSFETDEGTWMSVDISPDGNTLIFDLVGEIYTLPVAGGTATPLLTGLAFQSQPIYSPNGKQIAFLSDEDGSENLYIANADGSDAKKLSGLTNSGVMTSPAWSADGEYVYVAQVDRGIGANEIWAYHTLGGSGVKITSADADKLAYDKQPNAQDAVPSPDGRFLYYSAKSGIFEYNMDRFPWHIVRRDLQEGTTDTIVTAYGGAVRPQVSPDGELLIYGTRQEADTALRVRNLKTGADRLLAYPVTRDDQESRATGGLLPGYSFTPDGKAIIITSGGKFERIEIASGKRTRIPFKASVSLAAGPNLIHQEKDPQGPVEVRMIQGLSLSPDGENVAFSALGELYTMALKDGAEPQKLARAGEQVFQPSWSPNGRYLTYISWTPEGGQVWKINANGRGSAERISPNAAYYTEPAFTLDGERIVALRQSNQEFNIGGREAQKDLVSFDNNGGDVTVIMSATGLKTVHFGEAPDRVYLYKGAGDASSLMSVRLDGTDRRDHLRFTGTGGYMSRKPVASDDMRISPDGRWALALGEYQLHLVAVPEIDRDAQEVNLGSPTVPVRTLSDTGVNDFCWSRDGKTVVWSLGSTVFKQDLDDLDWESDKKDESDSKSYLTYRAKIEVPRDNPEGTMVLRGATVLTMGAAGVIENADVVVKDGKFAAAGARGSVTIPASAEVLDVSGKFITPGFIDTHAHWPAWLRSGVIEAPFWPLVANLAYGVTSGLDVQTSTADIFNYQDMLDAGRMIGQRAWSTGHGFFSSANIQSKEQVVDLLTRYRKHYRTKNLKAYISGNRTQRQYIVEAAKELGIMPTTEGGLDLKLNLTHMIDGFAGTEHNMPIATLYNDVAQVAAQTGIAYTPTTLVSYGGPWGENYYYAHMNPHDDAKVNRFVPHHELDSKSKRRPWFRDEEYAFSRIADSAIKIQRAGGRFGVGGHGQFQGLGYHWEMWSLGSGNGTPMEVLQAATIDGAHMIGHEQEVGSIEAGKFADLVILNSDPRRDLKNTTDIHRVMKNGRLYNDDTMEELWPRQKKLPALWFQSN